MTRFHQSYQSIGAVLVLHVLPKCILDANKTNLDLEPFLELLA